MPDAQALNAVLNSYGVSNLIGGSGDFNWWKIGGIFISGIIFSIIGWYAFCFIPNLIVVGRFYAI